MRLIKFSTFLVKITHKNSQTVSYQNYTDVMCRNFKHFCPPQAAFPYKHLEVGSDYTLICALLEVEGDEVWYWWKAFPMFDKEKDALVDPQLEEFISNQVGSQV